MFWSWQRGINVDATQTQAALLKAHTHTHLLSHGYLRTESWGNTFSIYSYEWECLVSYFLWLSCVWEVILWDFFASWHQAHRPARPLDATVDFEEIFWSTWSRRNVLTFAQQCLSLLHYSNIVWSDDCLLRCVPMTFCLLCLARASGCLMESPLSTSLG